MQSFYQDWLRKNNEENKRALRRINPQNEQEPIPSTSRASLPISDGIPITAAAIQSTSKGIQNIATVQQNMSTSDIVYQKDGLELLVERALFQRQKKFSLQVKSL